MRLWLCICTAEVKDEDIHTLAAWPNLIFLGRVGSLCGRVCMILLVLIGFTWMHFLLKCSSTSLRCRVYQISYHVTSVWVFCLFWNVCLLHLTNSHGHKIKCVWVDVWMGGTSDYFWAQYECVFSGCSYCSSKQLACRYVCSCTSAFVRTFILILRKCSVLTYLKGCFSVKAWFQG